VTDQPLHPHPHPGARRPRRPLPDARRALIVLGALLLSLTAAAAATPAASATSPPPEPPIGPPPPPAVAAPGLPLWAVLVIVGGTIALSAAITLVTLALHPTATRGPRPPARTPARAMHQPPPSDRPATRGLASAAIPAKNTRFVLTAQPLSSPRPRTAAAYPTSQEVVMNPIHRTRRLSVTLAGLAAAALALPAGQGTATAAAFTPPPTSAMATVQQAQSGMTIADLHDIAKVKRDLFLRLAQEAQTGMTIADLHDIAKVKRDLFWTLAKHSPRR
jgi:hypothetical protein